MKSMDISSGSLRSAGELAVEKTGGPIEDGGRLKSAKEVGMESDSSWTKDDPRRDIFIDSVISRLNKLISDGLITEEEAQERLEKAESLDKGFSSDPQKDGVYFADAAKAEPAKKKERKRSVKLKTAVELAMEKDSKPVGKRKRKGDLKSAKEIGDGELVWKKGDAEPASEADFVADIAHAKNFSELYQVIDQLEGLQGSKEFFTAADLKNIIERVRSGELSSEYVTRSGGLRIRVRDIMKAEHSEEEVVSEKGEGAKDAKEEAKSSIELPDLKDAGDEGGGDGKGESKKEEPVKEESPEKKGFKVAMVDVSSAIEDQARAVADRKMSESPEQNKGFWGKLKWMGKKIWKYNIAKEYYRQKEIAQARKRIMDSGDLYVDGDDKSDIKHDDAMRAVTERFVSEYEAEMVHKDSGEVKKVLGETPEEKKVQADIKGIIGDFASGKIDEKTFLEERTRIFSEVHRLRSDAVDRGMMFADNLLDIAKEVKKSVEHGAKLEELDIDCQAVIGRARLGARTEAQYNAVDRIAEKISASKVGRFVNEATVAASVAIVYSLLAKGFETVARSKVAAWGTFGATALVGTGIAAVRESKDVENERRQHAREMAEGRKFDATTSKRRVEMEKSRYKTREAGELRSILIDNLYTLDNGERKPKELNQEQFMVAMGVLAEIESRITMSDRLKIDLISYSATGKIEKERMALDLARAEAKVRFRKVLETNPAIKIPGGVPLDDFFNSLRETKSLEFTTGKEGLDEKNKLFRSMKRKRVAVRALKTFGYSVAIGTVFQELRALASDGQEGILEHMFGAKEAHAAAGPGGVMTAQNYTPLEYLRRLMSGELPRMDAGNMHEFVVGGNHFKLPEGSSIVANSDGTHSLMRGSEVVVDHFKLNPNGALTSEAARKFGESGIFFKTNLRENVIEGFHTPKDVVADKGDLFHKIKRLLWFDNDTPKPIFDKNELKLWWGGSGNTGIDAQGNYVFNVSQMRTDGSYHDIFSTDAKEVLAAGKLKLLLSLSRGTQGQVAELPIDASGNVVVNPGSEIGKLFFERGADGSAFFKGQFAEVAETMGNDAAAENFRILATHVGQGITEVPTSFVDRIHETMLDIPGDYDVYPPPFIPIIPRAPLEPTFPLPRVYYEMHSGGQGEREREEQLYRNFEKIRSKTLKENSQAKLDHFKEIEMYFKKADKKYRARLEKLADELGPMDEKTLVSVCIPVAGHQEGKNIYTTLENFKYQTANPQQYELVLFVNHPEHDKEGKKVEPDETLSEIERFKQDYPQMEVKVMYQVLQTEEATIWYIRKLLNDATLLRHHRRGEDAQDLIMVSNDADNKGVAPRYIQNFIDKFSQDEKVEGMLGELDWDPEAYTKYPLVHMGTRLFQTLNIIGRHSTNRFPSSGANFAFRSSIYAAIGGYIDPMKPGGEDVNIGKAIRDARADNGDKGYLGHAGAGISRVYTSARRAIVAMQKGFPPIMQWDTGKPFGPFDDEVRKADLLGEGGKIDYKDPEVLKDLKRGMEAVINSTLDVYEEGEKLGKGCKYYKRALRYLGIEYILNDDGNVIVTNFEKVVANLERYQERAVLIRDMKSGKPGAREQLEALNQEDEVRIKKEETDKASADSSMESFESGSPLSLSVEDPMDIVDPMLRSGRQTVFGDYIRLDSGVISEGDTGKVTWATNRDQNKAFVIKEKTKPRSGRVDAEKYLMDSKFSNEAVMLPLMRQENEQKVTKVYEAGSTDLDQYLAGKKISPKEAVSIVMRIAKGVRSLHEAGVIHGDIAPKNIIVSKDNVQLTDFDSSYVGDFIKEGASGNRFIMAPELFAFDKKVRFNESVDTYALGALLYFLLAGKWPHQVDETGLSGEEKQHVYKDLHENESIEFTSSIPEALQGVIKKAMSANPEERYVSANEFINAISVAY